MNITAIIGIITILLPVIVINCIIGGYSGFLGSYRILQGLCTVLQRTYSGVGVVMDLTLNLQKREERPKEARLAQLPAPCLPSVRLGF